MKYIIILILLLSSNFTGWAQKSGKISHREINIDFNDSLVKANVLLVNKKINLKNNVDYYWFYNNSIKHNQGGYKGKLLDGEYQVTLANGSLITKGHFKKGKKSGMWKQWNKQGELETITKWRNGVKKGVYKKYTNGVLTEKGTYSLNRLRGNYFVYENEKVIEKRKYKKGKEVVNSTKINPKKVRRSFVRKKTEKVEEKETEAVSPTKKKTNTRINTKKGRHSFVRNKKGKVEKKENEILEKEKKVKSKKQNNKKND